MIAMSGRKKDDDPLLQAVTRLGADVVNSDRFRSAWDIPHHRSENVALHSLRVAQESYRIAAWLHRHGIPVDVEDAVFGGLLHDIGMTEKQVSSSPSWKKAYSHPHLGAEIAENEYFANATQKDAVRRHMWPICVIPPSHAAGWIVLAADKIVSMREIFHGKRERKK